MAEVGDDQAYTFIDQSTNRFELRAPGQETVYVDRSNRFFTGRLRNGERLFTFNFVISASEINKLEKGTMYTFQLLNNVAKYQYGGPRSFWFE